MDTLNFVLMRDGLRSVFIKAIGLLLDIWFINKHGKDRKNMRIDTSVVDAFLETVRDITFYHYCSDDYKTMDVITEEIWEGSPPATAEWSQFGPNNKKEDDDEPVH
tara:strand:- start:4498 stop:4815 length:318 start_codon:yes stop_codon:yes gene_type:complete